MQHRLDLQVPIVVLVGQQPGDVVPVIMSSEQILVLHRTWSYKLNEDDREHNVERPWLAGYARRVDPQHSTQSEIADNLG